MAGWKIWRAGTHEIDDPKSGEFSVRLRNYSDGQFYWMDMRIDEYGDLVSEWNESIFSLSNSNDLHRKAVQEDAGNFELASAAAENYLLRKKLAHRTDDGEWHAGPGPKAA